MRARTAHLSGQPGDSPDLAVATDCTAFQQATAGKLYGQTTSNPFVCAEQSCATGEAACCRPRYPICVWTQTAPFASSGTDYGSGATAVDFCGLAPQSPTSFEFYVTKLSQKEVVFTIDFSVECTFTGGTLSWTAPPSWMLTINAGASCPDPQGGAPTTISLAGTYSGTH